LFTYAHKEIGPLVFLTLLVGRQKVQLASENCHLFVRSHNVISQ